VMLLQRAADPEAALRLHGSRVSRTDSERKARLSLLRRLQVRALPLVSPAYPPGLARLVDAAPLLLVQGRADVSILERTCVAIVGARAATAYGLDLARELGAALAGAGAVVVSGLARGIDAAAHRGALDAGGVTVAVQACGPDRVYPPEHRRLSERIAETGLLLTEMPPGTPPRAPYFPLRNRLISGLSKAVVVVEARVRSGSLVTARHALDQGVEVMAVPGPVGVPPSEGPNRLLLDGARPCLGGADLLEALGLEANEGDATPTSSAEPLAPEAQRVLEALAHAPASRDELAQRLGLGAEALAAPLLELELVGRVVDDRDGRLRVLRKKA